MTWKVRLFPAVAGAAGALLLLKAIDLGGPLLSGPAPGPTIAQTFFKVRGNLDLPDPLVTGSTPPKKEKKEPETPPPPPPGNSLSKPVVFDKPVQSPGEKAILEKLGERREALDERQRELDTRESLLKAADKKLEARINELRELEAKTKDKEKDPNKEPSEQQAVKNLVTMYETMKPKEAARVFDRLDLKVLVPVVNGMNPRKMSEILAVMSPEAAERLTVELAMRGLRASAASAGGPPGQSLPAGELQAIEPKRN